MYIHLRSFPQKKKNKEKKKNMTTDFTKGHAKSLSLALTSDDTYTKRNLNHLDLISKYGNTRDSINDIELYKNICSYEDTLNSLVESVDRYKPDIQLARELITVDKNLFQSLNEFSRYDKIDTKLEQLNKESQEIDLKIKDILDTLNECHDQLNSMPTLQQVEFEMNAILEQRQRINSKDLLEYATKLSKFTKAPPTFDKGSIGPNNFIWPAEDALRRGMLAMANLYSKELTKVSANNSTTDSNVVSKSDNNQVLVQNEGETNLENFESRERRSSFVFGAHSSDNEKENEDENEDDMMDLDLDLFNPDEL